MPVTEQDVGTLSGLCGKICYHLTAYLAHAAAGDGAAHNDTVRQVYQLVQSLPEPSTRDWALLSTGAVPSAAHAPAAGAKAPGKRMKWTAELEAELVRLGDDDDFRFELLGKDGTRGGKPNWAAVARHYGFSNSTGVKARFYELKGLPVEKRERKEKGEGADGEQPAKKVKAEADSTAKKAAPVPPTPATEATPADEAWNKAADAELIRLVESQDARKSLLGKKKLRWKRIGEHFGKKSKSCRKHYVKLTGKPAPEDED